MRWMRRGPQRVGSVSASRLEFFGVDWWFKLLESAKVQAALRKIKNLSHIFGEKRLRTKYKTKWLDIFYPKLHCHHVGDATTLGHIDCMLFLSQTKKNTAGSIGKKHGSLHPTFFCASWAPWSNCRKSWIQIGSSLGLTGAADTTNAFKRKLHWRDDHNLMIAGIMMIIKWCLKIMETIQ